MDVSFGHAAIRAAIALRYRLLPYLYTLLWQAHADDEPMLRPTFLDHEHDAQTFAECDEFLLGRDLLVASVVEPGQRERRLWLPDNQTGWYDFATQQWYRVSGSPCLRPETQPLLVRAGAALPLSERIAHVNAAADDRRTLQLYPLQGKGVSHGELFEDDGESRAISRAMRCGCSGKCAAKPQPFTLRCGARVIISRHGKRCRLPCRR